MDKYKDLLSNLQDWIYKNNKASKILGDLEESLADIPNRATECTTSAPEVFAELGPTKKSQMIEAVAKTVAMIKISCEKIK